MLIFIKTTFPNIPSSISKVQLLGGYAPGIEFPELIVLPIKKTSCIWFKSLLVEFLVIDMTTKTLEWKIINDSSEPFSKAVASKTKIEIMNLFKEFQKLAYQHNFNLIPFDKFLINLLLLLQTYFLPIINFQRTHIPLFDKVEKEQSQKIQQLVDQLNDEQIILKQNIDYVEDKIEMFIGNNISNYSQHFLEFLINSVDILIRDISDELQNNQQEIDRIVQIGGKNQLSSKREEREKLFKKLSHFFKMNDALKKIGKIPIRQQLSTIIQDEIHEFKTIWNYFVELKENIKNRVEQLNLAVSIKEEFVSYFIYLKGIRCHKVSIAESLLNYYSSQFLQSELVFQNVPEEMAALLTNPSFPFATIYQQFIDNFIDICKLIGQIEELWIQDNIEFDRKQIRLSKLWQKELKNNVKLKDLFNKKINEISKYDVLEGLNTCFQDHISEMCQKMSKYINILSENFDAAQHFIWQCYEKYLSSHIFLSLERLFRTLFSDDITKLQEILKNPTLIKSKPDLLKTYCSDEHHNHSTDNNCKTIAISYECLDFRLTFADAIQQIRSTAFCLSFSDACYSLENAFSIIEKTLMKSKSRHNVDDIIQITELIYLHCKPELFSDFFIVLQMLHIFLPTFLGNLGKTGHCSTTFYGVYTVFLENYKNLDDK